MGQVTEAYMNEIFKQECEEAGIPYEEFPFEFNDCDPINFGSMVKAMMWILKRRQDNGKVD